MEQKKLFIGLALVVAILALGVAYAAITQQTLNVAGNVTAALSDSNFDVSYDGAEGKTTITKTEERADGSATAISATASASGKDAVINVSGMDTENQEVTVVFTVKNNSADLNATLGDPQVVYDNTTWYTVTSSLAADTLTPGSSTTLTVKIKLNDTPATEAEVAAATESFHVSFTADAA